MLNIKGLGREIFNHENHEHEVQLIREKLRFEHLVSIRNHLLIGNDYLWLFLENGKKLEEARSFELTDDLADFLVYEGYSSDDIIAHDEEKVLMNISLERRD